MQGRSAYKWAAFAGAVLFLFPMANAQGPQLPPQKKQPTPQAVIAEHFAALGACDWQRVVAQYSENAEFLLPGGSTVKGRKAIGEMFTNFLKPHAQGGFCGMKTIPEEMTMIGGTVNVVWRIEAPFLAEPYRGSEAYETKDGLMVAQVSTFDPGAMKMKP
jgi:hypothetical protein